MIERYVTSKSNGCRFCGSKHMGYGICAPYINASIFECGHQEQWLVTWDEERNCEKYVLSWENQTDPVCNQCADDII